MLSQFYILLRLHKLYVKEWGHAVSVPGAYVMGFLIQLTTFHDLYNLSCEVYMWKVGISGR